MNSYSRPLWQLITVLRVDQAPRQPALETIENGFFLPCRDINRADVGPDRQEELSYASGLPCMPHTTKIPTPVL